jgi:putative peptidoglycan lipid II flippase
LGDVIAAAIYQSGRFTHHDAVYIWGILVGAAVGLLASTLGRLYASTYYALGDTRRPLYFAVVRIVIGTGVGYLCAIPLPPALGIEPRWGVAGLTLASSLAGWVELALLRGTLNRRLGSTGLPPSLGLKLGSAAVVGAAVAWAVKLALGPRHPVVAAGLILGSYGLIYVGFTVWWEVPEARVVAKQLARVAGKTATIVHQILTPFRRP